MKVIGALLMKIVVGVSFISVLAITAVSAQPAGQASACYTKQELEKARLEWCIDRYPNKKDQIAQCSGPWNRGHDLYAKSWLEARGKKMECNIPPKIGEVCKKVDAKTSNCEAGLVCEVQYPELIRAGSNYVCKRVVGHMKVCDPTRACDEGLVCTRTAVDGAGKILTQCLTKK